MSYSTLKPVLFAALFVAANVLFLRSVWRLARLARLGKDATGVFGELGDRIGKVVHLVFFQQRVVQERFGWNHVVFFWAFMIITVGHLEFILTGILPFLSLSFLGPVYTAMLVGENVMAFVVLFAVAAAVFRRAVIRPSYIHLTADGYKVLGLISGVMVTYFLATAFGIHGGVEELVAHQDAYPVSKLLAGAMAGVDPATAGGPLYEVFWWAHAAVLLTFLNVIPRSKHLHLVGSIPNIYAHKRDKHKAALTKLDFENSEVFGVGKVTDFTWKALLDTYACTECGRCDMYCPARRTGKPLEPQQLIHDIRDNLYLNGDPVLVERPLFQFTQAPADFDPKLPLIADSEENRQKGQTSKDVLWSCTSCGACVQACPVLIDHVDAIMDMRRHLTLMEGDVSPELATTFKNIENNYNPWGIGHDQRQQWAEGLGLKYWGGSDDASKFEFLLWVGCAGSYDNRAQKTMKAFTRVLDAAGVTYAILGQNERCTGDPARRAGNEYLFNDLATTNVATLNELGVKKVVTACPHCFNTLKNEYPAFGGHYEVFHHSQLIEKLLGEGKLKLTEEVVKKVTFHDPCFLGRWNDEVEAPRRSLAAVRRLSVVEMPEHGKKSMCCGAGGAQMWKEEMHGTQRVNAERTRQALELDPEVIAVACPFCMTMIEDGVKSVSKEEQVKVLDLAEVIASALPPAAEKPAPRAEA